MCASQLFCSNDLLRKIIGEGNSPKSLGKKMEFVFAFFGAKKIELRASFYSGEWQRFRHKQHEQKIEKRKWKEKSNRLVIGQYF